MIDHAPTDTPHKANKDASSVSLSGSVGLLGVSNGVAFGAGLIRQKVFAVFLGPAGVGALSLAMAFFELLTTLVRMGIPTGLLREASRALSAGQPSHVARAYHDSARRVLWVAGGVLLLCTVLALPLRDLVFGGVLPLWAAPVLALALPFILVAQLRESLLSAHGRIARLAGGKVIITLLSLVATVTLVATWGLAGGVAQIAAGAAIASVVTALALRPVFHASRASAGSVPRIEAHEAAQRIFRVGGAEALYHIGVTFNLLLFRSVVVSGLGLDANGLYQVVLGLSRQYVPAVLGGVFVSLYPRLSALADRPQEMTRERGEALRYVFILGVPLALTLLATRDWLIAIVLTQEFVGAQELFRWTAPGDVLLLLGGVLQISLLAGGQARRFVIVGLVTEAVYLLCFVVAVGRFGLDGAAAAYLVAGAVALYAFARAQGLGLERLTFDVGRGRLVAGMLLVAATAITTIPLASVRWWALGTAAVWLWIHRAYFGMRGRARG